MTANAVKPAQTALLVGPPEAERGKFLAMARTSENHAAALAGLECLQRLEAPATALAAPLGFPLTIAAWNLERCYNVEKSAALLSAEGARLVLLSEVDNGMDRTGQRHTSREIATGLGQAYAFGVEFLELEAGNATELAFCKDGFNRHGFHGNALLAAAQLQAPVLIRLPDQLFWFNNEVSARIGSRCAILATLMTEMGPLCAVSVHLESRGDAAHRHAQMAMLFDSIDSLVGDMPVVLGGDMNTGLADGGDFEKETLFAEAAARGYTRYSGALHQTTTRSSRVSREPKGTYKLDWFLTREIAVSASRIVAAVAPDGEVLSDHEMVVIEVAGLSR